MILDCRSERKEQLERLAYKVVFSISICCLGAFNEVTVNFDILQTDRYFVILFSVW